MLSKQPLLQTLFLSLVILLSSGCRSSKQETQQVSQDTASASNLPAKGQPTVVKDNLTLIGAVIEAIDTTGGILYICDVELRTAIPVGEAASLAEPGQHLRVRPLYHLDGSGRIDPGDERNKRLTDAGTKKVGDFLFGKISLGKNGTWYLIDTELR